MAGPGLASEDRVMVAVSASSSVEIDKADIRVSPWFREASWKVSSGGVEDDICGGRLDMDIDFDATFKGEVLQVGGEGETVFFGDDGVGELSGGAVFHVGSLVGGDW